MLSKYLPAISLVFLSLHTFPQKPEPTYYDIDWKPCDPLLARFVTIITPTDSGHLRSDYYISNEIPQMKAHYADAAEKIRHGQANYYYPNGKPSAIGQYNMNKRHGICISYHYNGMMSDSGNYDNGRIVGYKMGWHANGFQSDSIFQRNDSISAGVFWFDDGSPSMAGLYLNGERTGTWQFFYKGGGLAKKSVYQLGKEVTAQYFDQKGNPMKKPLEERKATFKGGTDGWVRHLEKNLYWPEGYKFNDGNQATVSVSFTINEDGKVADAYVDVPFHPEFDKIALKTIKQSQGWQPAVQHNRVVSYNHRQRVTFSQPE
jgi:TonB family protein